MMLKMVYGPPPEDEERIDADDIRMDLEIELIEKTGMPDQPVAANQCK